MIQIFVYEKKPAFVFTFMLHASWETGITEFFISCREAAITLIIFSFDQFNKKFKIN